MTGVNIGNSVQTLGNLVPKHTLPMVWCDLNAAGWAGGDDSCYHVLDHHDLARLQARTGMRVFIYDDDLEDEQPVIVGCAATLERYKGGWRA